MTDGFNENLIREGYVAPKQEGYDENKIDELLKGKCIKRQHIFKGSISKDELDQDFFINILNLVMPIATIIQTALASDYIPEEFLICNGQAISRDDYSELFLRIGTTYGVGDGSTTFNIPNLQGKVPVGVSLTDTDFDLADTGGHKELQSHTHKVDPPNTISGNITANHTHNTGAYTCGSESSGYGLTSTSGFRDRVMVSTTGGATSGVSADHQHYLNIAEFDSGSAGTGTAKNLQPFIALNFIIKVKNYI